MTTGACFARGLIPADISSDEHDDSETESEMEIEEAGVKTHNI